MGKNADRVRQTYQPSLSEEAGVLEQSFRANHVVAEKQDADWLISFGDLIGDDALGNKRPPLHSLLVYVHPEDAAGKRWSLHLEFNDQGNTRDAEDLEKFELTRHELRIRVRPGSELWSGRVSYTPDADPCEPSSDPKPQAILGVRVAFDCTDRTYETIAKALARVRGRWITIVP